MSASNYGEEEGLSFVRKQKTDVGVIFTAFDENKGARRAHGISDSAEAKHITFMTPIFILIFAFHICPSVLKTQTGPIGWVDSASRIDLAFI